MQATRYRRQISDFITPFLKIINQAEMDFPISEQYRVIKLFPQSIIKGENPQLGFKSHSGSKTYRRIMNELVPLIREAKKSRQIIMSTHNANLVVNADAEQIIVAQLDQGKGYISGSIENGEINKNIRDILEGGEEAFKRRERKYITEKV